MEIKFPGKILLDGESGCGKSTLLKLMCGLYQPESGEVILFAGSNKISGEKLAEYISYVEQASVIINGTLEENILFGDYWDSIDTGRRHKILEDAVKKQSCRNFTKALRKEKIRFLAAVEGSFHLEKNKEFLLPGHWLSRIKFLSWMNRRHILTNRQRIRYLRIFYPLTRTRL